ncbi:PREDICTED: uncharacterized protein LOC105460807 [Wasmannia auropunctata]|uniref:uncharacterized protein LOC105460807 n=1 Tax=Wasmannia auropunctata TaxID=64793 RepID=UPI0005ED7119|nr:PREDICTED: uncharacterized protein LOC105460807 [Wasmannia auropunctata]
MLYSSPIFGKIDMLLLPAILGGDSVLLFGNLIMIVTFILTVPRMHMLQTILKISSRLPSESYEKLSRLIHAKDIIGILYVVGFVFICALTLQINLWFEMYINLVTFQLDMLYMNCVCVVKACFKEIDDNLTNMRQFIANNKSHVPNNATCVELNYHYQRNQFLIMDLKALRKQHLAISDTVQMLNMIFSLQLLATVIMTFSNITFNLYYILSWEHLSRNMLTNGLYDAHHLLYTMYLFMKIVLIVWACETGKNQAQQISTSIHNMFNSTTDKQIKNEVI